MMVDVGDWGRWEESILSRQTSVGSTSPSTGSASSPTAATPAHLSSSSSAVASPLPGTMTWKGLTVAPLSSRRPLFPPTEEEQEDEEEGGRICVWAYES